MSHARPYVSGQAVCFTPCRLLFSRSWCPDPSWQKKCTDGHHTLNERIFPVLGEELWRASLGASYRSQISNTHLLMI